VSPDKAKLPYIGAGVILTIVGFILFNLSPWIAVGAILAAAVCFIGSTVMPARTATGVDLRDYLYGVRDYMKLAEADRIKVLQSPHGDLTEKVDVGDNTQLVKLYEKLLPYAMLFGIEKDWAKEMAPLYTEQPDWYTGNAAFNAAWFAGSL